MGGFPGTSGRLGKEGGTAIFKDLARFPEMVTPVTVPLQKVVAVMNATNAELDGCQGIGVKAEQSVTMSETEYGMETRRSI